MNSTLNNSHPKVPFYAYVQVKAETVSKVVPIYNKNSDVTVDSEEFVTKLATCVKPAPKASPSLCPRKVIDWPVAHIKRSLS